MAKTDDGTGLHGLLPASSFMTPQESRAGTNLNQVRMFVRDNLDQATVDQKWDRIKVVCLQPFNKNLQFGLSFVKFHSPPEERKPAADVVDSESVRIGSFRLKTDDSGSTLAPGTLFAKRNLSLTDGAEIPASAAKVEAKQLLASLKTKTPSKRKPSESVCEHPAKKPASKSPASEATKTKVELSVGDDVQPKKTTGKKSFSQKIESKVVPFDEIMSGVVFVLSGFANPLRSDLRDKAIAMGAKYSPDWDDGCNHLVCAFPNTPKFQQVKKLRGKIVSKNWILDCHHRKSALPWSKYSLKAEGEDDDDDDDNDADSNGQLDAVERNKGNGKSPVASITASVPPIVVSKADSDDEYNTSTDVGSEDRADSSATEIHSDDDTDVEIQSVVKLRAGHDDAVVDTTDLPMPELPNFFEEARFFLYGDFESELRRRLVRYITAFNGVLEDYMSAKVKYVITKSDWNDEFDTALTTNVDLIFAKPSWLLACAARNRRVPYQPYLVVP